MEDMIIDMRLHRTRQIAALILNIAGKYIPSDEQNSMRKFHDELFELLHKNGAEIISDLDRHQAGLPLRGPRGWTDYEMQILEAKRMELMLKPMAPIFLTEPR